MSELASRYHAKCAASDFEVDPQQLRVVEMLESLRMELVGVRSGGWSRPGLMGLVGGITMIMGRHKPSRGLYIWGGVGRGKTFLMDLFCQSLAPDWPVNRFHFHRFMLWVQQRLTLLRGTAEPLDRVADELIKYSRLLCFDEFHVTEIGDAMILGRLLEQLFKRGGVLVATSNIPPGELYANGLHRERFMPTIALLETRTRVVQLDSKCDYRLRNLKQHPIYYSPLDALAAEHLHRVFATLTAGDTARQGTIQICGRDIATEGYSSTVLWCSFEALCLGPRAASDYIEIARLFPTVLLSAVPAMTEQENDAVRRFITLIDEFYEYNVKLVLTAAVPINSLYRGTKLAFEFRRTRSRLEEMQSEMYFARLHLT